MQLTDGETQASFISTITRHPNYKGQASGGSAANTTVAFSALVVTAFMDAVLVTTNWVQFI